MFDTLWSFTYIIQSYIIQCRYLNSVPALAITEIKEKWPFIFSQRGLYSHFGLLKDVSILIKLQEALDNRGSTVIQFCQELNCHPGIQDILANFEPEASDKAACILLLLMAYFKEPKNAVMLETRDVTRTDTSVPSQCNNFENVTVLGFLHYLRYQGFNSSARDRGSIYTNKCWSLPLNAKGRQKMATAAFILCI